MFWPAQKPDFGLFVVFKPFQVPVLLNHQRKRSLITNLTSTTVQLHYKFFFPKPITHIQELNTPGPAPMTRGWAKKPAYYEVYAGGHLVCPPPPKETN